MKVLRVVTLGSATGKYGGPFDTSISQARILSEYPEVYVTVLAGHLRGDKPAVETGAVDFISREVHSWVGRVGFAGLFSWSLLKQLFRQIRRTDVVHISFSRELVPLLAAIIGIVLRKPLVLQPHGMLTARTSRLHRLADHVIRTVYRRANCVIALTGVEKNDLVTWASRSEKPPIEVLGNPLPFAPTAGFNAEAGLRPVDKKAVFIARLHRRKRVADFVEACRFAESRNWSDEYEVVGPDQGDAAQVISASRSLSNLTYRGAVPSNEIDGILRAASVFVLTSENEPWGNVLVAALKFGLPVVVTESAALADEIRDNQLGIVVPDRSPEAVAIAVHAILTEVWRTPEGGLAAEEYAAERFDQDAIKATLFDLYRRVNQRMDVGQTDTVARRHAAG